MVKPAGVGVDRPPLGEGEASPCKRVAGEGFASHGAVYPASSVNRPEVKHTPSESVGQKWECRKFAGMLYSSYAVRSIKVYGTWKSAPVCVLADP